MCAGQGKRLRPLTDETPKSMLEVGGKTLLARHLDHLAALGIERAVVVVGFRREKIEALVARGAPAGLSVLLPRNDAYDMTGSGYSLSIGLRALAESGFQGDVMFMDADLLYPRALLSPLLEPTSVGNALLVGKGREEDDEAVKVRGPTGKIRELAKKTKRKDLPFQGESVGIGRLTPAGTKVLTAWMAEREKTTRDYEWEHAVEGSAEKLDLKAVRAPDLPWTEIDTVQDLERAKKMLPQVE